MKVLVVAPSRREAAVCGPGTVVCGSGTVVDPAVEARLARDDVDVVILAGVCGGLDPSLVPGSLILARRVMTTDGVEITPKQALFETARRLLRARRVSFVSSGLLTLARPAGSRHEKTELWNAHGAAGVDMESFAVAAATERHGAGWLVIRAVLDPAASGLPAGVRDWQGSADEAQIVRRMARSPLQWQAYVKLALELRKALAALRQAVPLVVSAASSSATAAPTSEPAGGASRESLLAVVE